MTAKGMALMLAMQSLTWGLELSKHETRDEHDDAANDHCDTADDAGVRNATHTGANEVNAETDQEQQ